MKKSEKPWLKKYKEIEEIGEGGNGKVILVESLSNGKQYALKYLVRSDKEKVERFKNEIKIIEAHFKKVVGLIPINDYSFEELWYVMEYANPILPELKKSKFSLNEIIKGVIELCETLEALHLQGVSHRDIKPDNILIYKNRYYFGDFGLAFDPAISSNITQNVRDLGAHFTIAPEMKRYPKEADGCKADVYSLAKTLWMLISQDEKGFDGQYSYNSDYKLRNYNITKNHHVALLEELLTKATEDNPEKRITISDFKAFLKRWETEEQLFFKAEETEWQFLVQRLFPTGLIPERTKWTNLKTIVDIFNLFSTVYTTEHLLFPDGGGMNYKKAELAPEKNCMYLIDDANHYSVVSPKCLYYETFSDQKWNYFILDLNFLEPILERTNINEDKFEILCEDLPAHYVDAKDFVYGVYEYDSGKKLPAGAKEVDRYIKGRFLIVLGNGYYNSISSTYDGRHSDADSCDSFRNYIYKLSKITDSLTIKFKKNPKKDIFIENLLNSEKISKNPFIKKNETRGKKERKKVFTNIEKHIIKLLRKLSYKHSINRSVLNEDGICNFYITYSSSIVHVNLSSIEKLDHDIFYLTKQGKFSTQKEKRLVFHSRDSLKEVFLKLQKRKAFFCKLFKINQLIWDFNMHVEDGIFLPKIFSLDDIKKVMYEADDRKTHWLVIDEKGDPLLVDNTEIRNTYPLYCSESFSARTRNVGKYSDLNAAERCYHSLLIKYLTKLKNEDNIYKYDNLTDEEIILKIHECYKIN